MSVVASVRLEAARILMDEKGIDLLLIGPSADMFFLMGRRLPMTERLNFLAVPRRGRAVIVAPRLQLPLVDNAALSCDVLSWDETEDPFTLTADLVARLGAKRIGVNSQFWAGFLLQLQHRLPAASFSDAAAVMTPLRLCKDEEEIAVLEEGAHRFDALWRDFFADVKIIGRTEHEIGLRIADLARDHGFDALAWCDVGSGPNGASPLHHWSNRRVVPGDPVVIDFAAAREGYYMDTCRTPVAGEPHPDFVAIYDLVNRAHDAAAAAIRPGVAAEDVDRAARRVITDAGYGDLFLHRVGHGLGIDAHEEPYIVAGNCQPLAAGMVFSNEPGIYVPDRWGVRIENIMVVTDTGGRSLNRSSRHLVTMS
ncbi:M24 family metallopeptidase [Mesorhizobium sp. Root172]|jgi:Xaa-Pro aminopeptidase|uniref:M24 family metallopeptidase n=1 Tax=Mesorhizobium sp. Root172 TaxID=1736481 RepID=UPI0006F50779|nr:Xaa-Pro peptidase family protein [Mesorhizobium sp. Root172]KRB29683.1 dipeptidase [Mesorhizobium sp. Root172]